MRQFLSRVYEIYQPFRFGMLVIAFLLIFMQALSLLGPYIVGKTFNLLYSRAGFGAERGLIVLFGIVSVVALCVRTFKDNYELSAVDFSVRRHMAVKTLEKVLDLSIGQHRSQHSGVTASVVNKGEHSLSSLAFTFVYEICPIFCLIFLASLFVIFINWQIALITFTGSFVFLVISWFMNKRFWPEMKELEKISQKSEKIRSELLRNISLVILNVQGISLVDLFQDTKKHYDERSITLFIKYHFYNFLRNLSMILTHVLVLYFGFYYVETLKVLTPGDLIIVSGWSQMIFGNITNLGNLHRRCLDMMAAVKIYFQILDIEPEIKNVSSALPGYPKVGTVEFQNVSFSYPKVRYIETEETNSKIGKDDNVDLDTLKNISFKVEAGSKVAIVGSSGAGKSTIINLLLRAYDPNAGRILIDQEDLKNLKIEDYRSRIGLVEQNVGLFDDSLRFNILFGLSAAQRAAITNEDLKRVAKLACIDKFYDRLTEGFETEIGENGIELSGGERQRVGIARAIIKNPAILILDEATSNIDSINEKIIKLATDEVSLGRTTIIIAHRLSTVRDADKIIVMDKGRVVGVGKHEDLMKNCEIYRTLVETQMFM
ncbi:MAG: ABC transporter ATP-binding protein [Candidatus Vogelbacteria bacterium]|nr:ABC transporter ATP-binding protein [Candidatus Vogelbacteria bacterium]